MKVEVLTQLNSKQIDKTFTYLVPENLKEKIKVGIRVLIPFLNKKIEGIVLRVHNEDTQYKCKNIIDVVDEYPILNEEMIKLGDYISKKTMSTKISAYQTMLPKALKVKAGNKINKKYEIYVTLVNYDYKATSNKQQQIIDLIKNKKVLKNDLISISKSSYKTLLTKEVIKEIKEEVYRLNIETFESDKKIILTDEQKNVIKIIKESLNKFQPFLLHGVTGSGKTEVYMRIIDEVIKQNKQAIVLVPEISLTPQLTSRFKNRFKENIAILHSGLSDGERYDEYRKIVKGKVSIVIGARSAIFAPLSTIGVIIIDEEHSATYKQENNPKYDAIDIALKRAKNHNCPVILGSATPSIESYTRTKTKVYQLLNMKKRVNKLPKVYLVDMKDEIKHGNKIFSKILDEKIKEKLEKNEQIILLLNRRGYSTIISCHECGYTHKCPHCDIPLVYHKKINTMKCHYCGYATKKMMVCPECKSKDINEFGMGTQKLEEYVKNKYPKARVLRMDNDTTRVKGAYENKIKSFSNHEYDILLGTQMIAKGLDFPLVTLVGVLNCDATLQIPDFRSGQRTFELLNQVSGRAGRADKEGEVILQGFNVDHYSIIAAKNNDYDFFYKKEIDLRKKLGYPPYQNLCMIELKGKNQDYLLQEGKKIQNFLIKNLNHNEKILGPSISNVPKINDIYSVQLIIKYKITKYIWPYLSELINHYKINNKLNIGIDINK